MRHMPYEEQFITTPLTGQENEGISEDVLPLPNFRRLENFVYEKEGEFSLRRNLTLLTNFFKDNPIQFFTYKDQLLVIGERGIYRYDETQKEFSRIFQKENIKISLDLISQKERSILYPSIFFSGDICYIFYFSDDQILYKRFDVRERQVDQAEEILESSIEVSGISSGRYGNDFFYSYSTGTNIFVKQIESVNNTVRQFMTSSPVVDHKLIGNRVYYTVEGDTTQVLNEVFTGSSTTDVETVTFRDNFSGVQTLGGGFTLFDFRLWSEFILDENQYQLIWTPEIGMFIVNNKGIIVAKFNSNFVPLVFDTDMKYVGNPKTINLNDGRGDIVYIPILQAGQDEFGTGEDSRTVVRPLNIALLNIRIANDTVETGIANDQMLIAGEQLTYYDGERIVEQGFAERPKISITSNPNPFIRNTLDIPITTDTETVTERILEYTQMKETGFHYNPNTFRIRTGQDGSGDITGYRPNLGIGSLTSGSTTLSFFTSGESSQTSFSVTDVFYDSDNRYFAVQLNNNAKVGGISLQRVTDDDSASLGCVIFHEDIEINGKQTFVFYTPTNLFSNNTEYDLRVIPLEKYNSMNPIGEFNEQIELTNANYIDVLDYENQTGTMDLLSGTFDLRELDFINNIRRVGVGNVSISEVSTENTNLLRLRSIETGDENTDVRTSNYGTGQGSILEQFPTNSYFTSVDSLSARFEKIRIDLNNDETMESVPDLTIRTSVISNGNSFATTINPIPNNLFFSTITGLFFTKEEFTVTTPQRIEEGLIIDDFTQNNTRFQFSLSNNSVIEGNIGGNFISDVFSNNIFIRFDFDDRRISTGNTGAIAENFDIEFGLQNAPLTSSSRQSFLNSINYPLNLFVTGEGDTYTVPILNRASDLSNRIRDGHSSREFDMTLNLAPNRTNNFDYKLEAIGGNRVFDFPENNQLSNFMTRVDDVFNCSERDGRVTCQGLDSDENVILNFSESGWLQTQIASTSVTNTFTNFFVSFRTKETYTDTESFLDRFAPTGEITFAFATHNDRNRSNKTFTFSSSRSDINNASELSGPKVTYSNQIITFGIRVLESSSLGQFLDSYSGTSTQVIPLNMRIRNSSGDVIDVFPGREASTMRPSNIIDNLKSNNIELILKINTSSSYSSLNNFYQAINTDNSTTPPQIILNDINLSFLDSYRNHSVSGNVVTFQYTVPGTSIRSNSRLRDQFTDLLDSGPDFTLDVHNNINSLFSTSVTDSTATQTTIPGLGGIQVSGIDVDSVVLSTFLFQGENRLEDVEFTFRVPDTSPNTAFDDLDNIEAFKVSQTRQGIEREIYLSTDSEVFTLTEDFTINERSGFRFQRYKWTSRSRNGTDSLDNYNYRSGFTGLTIESSEVVGQIPSVTKSLFQVDFTGTNIAQDDINPAFIIRQGVDIVPLGLTNFASTSSKAFLRTEGNISNVPYPFRQRSNLDLEIIFYVISTETVETGETQTVDNLADRRAYIYSAVFKWVDGRGFEHRSTQALQKDVLSSQDISEDNPIGLTIKCLNLTTRDGVKIDLYRTKKNTLVLRKVAEIINRKEAFVISYTDIVVDDDLGEVLLADNFHPDGCDSIEVFNDQFFLAGFQNFRNKIQFSDPLNFGGSSSVKFTEGNSILAEEDVVALRKMDIRLVIFTNRAVYVYPPSNAASNAPQLIEGSVNVSSVNKNAIQRSPSGLIFQSELGFYLLDRGLKFGFVGDPIKDLSRKEVVIASSINKANQENLFFTDRNSTIVFNYFYNKWSTFSDGAKYSLIHKNALHTLDKRGNIWVETRDSKRVYTGVMETGWLQLSSIKNYQKIKSFFLIGRFKNLQSLCVYIYYDYSDFIRQVIPVNFNQISEPIPNFDLGSPRTGYGLSDFSYGQPSSSDIRQFRFMLRRQKCSSIKLRFCVEAEEAVLSAFRFQLRLLPGSGRVPSREQFSRQVSNTGA